jgi:hypothetical protein
MRQAIFRIAGVGLVLLGLGGTALAKVSLRVEVGWEGMYRVNRWTPIYITAADDEAVPARNVILEVLAPHDNMFAMRIVQPLTLRVEPTVYLVYVPLTQGLDESVIVIRDARTRRKLAERSLDPSGNIGSGRTVYYGSQGGDELLVGVSGRRGAMGMLNGQFDWQAPAKKTNQQTNNNPSQRPTIRTGYLEARRLPDAPQGYSGLDILVLYGPDLTTLRLEQQQAIADWIYAGGRLVLYPGESLMPPDSPIVKLLPCRVGESSVIELSLEDCRKMGVPSRLEKLPCRALEPAAGAKMVSLPLAKAAACCGRVGLGEVAVLSADVSQLAFDQHERAVEFWKPVLAQLIKPPSQPRNEQGYAYVGYEDGQRLMAMQTVVDRLGNVPGVGTFDFTYIALVMVAMMLIVGPVDWLVLKKLGRQPWTWATTTGWIVLVTTGALYIGYLFRSGDLYYRTVRLVDQADGRVVAALDVAGIYSPKTQVYEIEGPREAWWEPASLDMAWRRSQRLPTEFTTVQDARSNRPVGMTISVWNLRFMQSELGDPGSQPAVIQAQIRRVTVQSQPGQKLAGTITNLSPMVLKNIHLRCQQGAAELPQSIKAGQTLTFDVPLVAGDRQMAPPPNANYNPWGTHNAYGDGSSGSVFMRAACDLAAGRSERIERLLAERQDVACIYAECEGVTAAVRLKHANKAAALEQHYQVVRALVELKQVDDAR